MDQNPQKAGQGQARSVKNICIVGVGGVGGYFGGMLLHGLGETGDMGKKVFFVARGAHLQEIRRSGLVVNTSRKGRLVVTPALATDRIEEVPPPDLCLLCVKSYDLDEVVRRLAALIEEETIVLPLLNGVDMYDRIRKNLRTGVVLPACVYVGTHIESPGVVAQKGGDGVILCGPDPQLPDFDHGPLSAVFQEGGIRLVWNEDPYPAIWEKYIFIAGFGLVTALSGRSLGEVAADASLREMTREIMEEIRLVARACHISLPDDIVETSLRKAEGFPFETRTSYQRDVEERRVQNEGDLFGATIVRLGRAMGIAVSGTERACSLIRDDIPEG